MYFVFLTVCDPDEENMCMYSTVIKSLGGVRSNLDSLNLNRAKKKSVHYVSILSPMFSLFLYEHKTLVWSEVLAVHISPVGIYLYILPLLSF